MLFFSGIPSLSTIGIWGGRGGATIFRKMIEIHFEMKGNKPKR